jgi:ABC-type transport system involved in multi-copper enzyme maturation permease subunit
MTALAGRLPLRRLRRPVVLRGISAILVKDLRGRMRGRRAFITLTIYLVLLAGFAWMIEKLSEQSLALNAACFGCGPQTTFASASIGRGIFVGILMLQTLVVSVLAPASTAGSISGEREHQTLDLLTVTPISSLAIVLGKLLSALAWVFVLVLASVPITGLVFLFGGVAPDDVVRGYAVVLATAIGLGSVGLFFSSLLKRTGASTGLTYLVMLILSIGTAFVWFWTLGTSERDINNNPKTPAEQILWLNPYVAQADVACGTEGGFGSWCAGISEITGTPLNNFNGGVTGGGAIPPAVPVAIDSNGNPIPIQKLQGQGFNAAPDAQPFAQADTLRDRFWPKTVISFVVLATIMTLASVQVMSPTRRWRFPGLRSTLRRRRAAAPSGPGAPAVAAAPPAQDPTPESESAPEATA